MKQQERPSIKVFVSTLNKGCVFMVEILKNFGYEFTFLTSYTSIPQHTYNFLILDDNTNFQRESTLIKHRQKIVLTDTNKSSASILALSGQLSTFGQNQKSEFVPQHILDFIVGIGLTIYLLQFRNSTLDTSKEQLKISLIDLAQYYGAFNISAKENGFLKNPLGKNLLDGGAPFYGLYKCKEGTLAIGNLEPKFYQEMIKGLGVSSNLNEFLAKNQFNVDEWQKVRKILKETFVLKSANEWEKIMSSYDTCVTQVSLKPRNSFKVEPEAYRLKAKL